ncbi:MAG TPA: helix-turn-helix domain-containing protein [Thermoleophilaceae bacterium]|jgi:CRP-like cAMP-binding protein
MIESTVSLLHHDPDLGRDLPPAELLAARRALPALSVTLEPGTWDWASTSGRDRPPDATMLVLDGLLLLDVELASCPSAELIGPGDVLPSLDRRRNAETLLPMGVELAVLEPTRVALLDESFHLACARWPSVMMALLERMEQRSWRLTTQAAICHLPAVHLRLLALFWHLADRWGKVGPDHLVLPLRLLHRTLGKMVGAERPTVSLALRQLSDGGLVMRRPDGAWLLRRDPSEGLELLTRCNPRPASLITDSGRDGHGVWRPDAARVSNQR